MLSTAEIEAAIDALPKTEQESIYSHLAAKLSRGSRQDQATLDQDPVSMLIKRLEQELPSEPRTNVAADYKKALYGSDSGE